MVAEQPALSFAGLLRRLRAEAKLTQEELAAAAGVSARSVSNLERGINRTAHKDTALLLAGALGLDGPARMLFVAAARGRGAAADVLAARPGRGPGVFQAAVTRALPRDIAAFTGRRAELARLTGTLASLAADGGVVGIHAIGGMAGIGKTTFAVHAAHRLAASFPDGQFFLPLHAHTAGQRPVDPADALASLLLAAGVRALQIPPDLEARAARWRDCVAGRKILLVLDDAAGHEQVRPLLPGSAGSLVLVTSRRRLAALEDAAVISLDILSPDEAAALLARLAVRPGLDPGDAAVGEITRLCGYLPLAIGMLAGQLRHHPAWTPATLAAELGAAKDRLELMAAENLSVAAAFGLSYHDLDDGQQRLFRRLGLHPGPDIDAHAAAALDDTSPGRARRGLEGLYNQHLITQPAPGRYRFHDLLREHARALAEADAQADRAAAVGRLLDYYADTALAASTHMATRMVTASPAPPSRPPPGAPPVSTPRQAATWLQIERANLLAVGSYAARAHPERAIAIAAAMTGFLDARGHWDQAAALRRGAVTAARQIGDKASQARALNDLAGMQGQTGDYRAATASVTQALALYRELGDRAGQACALNNLGLFQHYTGKLQAAVASHRQALELFADLGHQHGQGDVLTIHMLTGDYPAAVASLWQALELPGDLGHQLGQGDTFYNLANLASLQHLTGDWPAAAATWRLFREFGMELGQGETLNNLDELLSRSSVGQQARDHHTRALAIARDLGAPQEEAHALEGIGRCDIQDGNPAEGGARLREALAIYQRIGAPDAARVQETLRDLSF